VPASIPVGLIPVKNELSGASPLVLVEISVPGEATPFRLVRNNEDVTWPTAGGDIYTAYGLTVTGLQQSANGNIETMELQLTNAARLLESYVQEVNGIIGGTVVLRKVFADHLDETEPAQIDTLTVIRTRSSVREMTLSLGPFNPFTRRFPAQSYIPNACRWQFRGPECGFTGRIVTSTAISFQVVAGLSNDTITRGSGSWITDAYADDMSITVSGSTSNDGTYQIVTVGATTLTVEPDLVAESAGATITVSAACPGTIPACKTNGQIANYGGAPGSAEGIYAG